MQDLCKQVLYTVKKPILVFFLIILISSIVLAENLVENYNDPITYSMGDLRWCRLYGVCTLSMLTLDNLVVHNLSVIGEVFNVTMNLVTWNITESFNVGGNLEAKNITATDKFIGDGSLLTSLTHSLDDAYDDGSVITVDDTNVIWKLGATNEFIINSSLGKWYLSPSINSMDLYLEAYPTHTNEFGVFDEDGGIYIGPDGNGHGFIESDANIFVYPNSGGGGVFTSGSDNIDDLGGTSTRWKNIYAASNISDGTNSLTVANAKTAYDYSQIGHLTNGTGFVNIGTVNTSTACINNSCIDDWSEVNVSVTDTTVNNTGYVNITELTVRNITSPYANKSYLFFQPDGSVGITLDPIIPLVQAQEPLKEKTITRTSSTETVCSNGKCHLVLYSGVRFVEEEGRWKDIREAKSLKNAWNVVYLKSDGDHIIDVIAYNYTSITFDLEFVGNPSEYEYEVDDNKVKIKFKINKTLDNGTEIETEQELEIEENKKTNFIYNGNPLGKKFTFGTKSTTLILQEPDTENLNDDGALDVGSSVFISVFGSGLSVFQPAGVMFNISAIPTGQIMDNAVFYIYQEDKSASPSFGQCFEYSNRNWNEEDGISDRASMGTLLDSHASGSINVWHSYNITSWVSSEYNDNYKNVSIALNDSNTGTSSWSFFTKEYTGDITLRPYLNITYHSVTPSVSTTLTSPTNNSIDTDGTVTFECSGIATNSTLDNITLYTNISGTWQVNETDTSSPAEFTIGNIANNTNLIWNCLSSNNEGNTSFADANWTLTVQIAPTKNPKFFIQNLTGDEQWYVDMLGNMWLRNVFTVDGISHFGGGYGNTGVTIYDDGNTNMDGDLIVDGNVGIGNTTPQHKLSVQGNVYTNGTVFASGINITSSFFDLTANENNSLRFTLKNLNNGSGAAAVITAENDVGGTMSIGVVSENYMIGDMSYPNATTLISRSKGDMAFVNSYDKAFSWLYNPSDDNDLNNLVEVMRLDEDGLNVSKNITAPNVFLPQYVFSHNNETIPLLGASTWTNVTFTQEEAHIKLGITHTHNDATNTTFTINADGIYDLDYDFDVIDTSASSTDIDVAGRAIYSNGTEIDGSVFETDITKKDIETEISHDFLAELRSGDKIVFQFVAADADVEISTHGTFGVHPESATIRIFKIANLP